MPIYASKILLSWNVSEDSDVLCCLELLCHIDLDHNSGIPLLFSNLQK